jgi:hypothetical protein
LGWNLNVNVLTGYNNKKGCITVFRMSDGDDLSEYKIKEFRIIKPKYEVSTENFAVGKYFKFIYTTFSDGSKILFGEIELSKYTDIWTLKIHGVGDDLTKSTIKELYIQNGIDLIKYFISEFEFIETMDKQYEVSTKNFASGKRFRCILDGERVDGDIDTHGDNWILRNNHSSNCLRNFVLPFGADLRGFSEFEFIKYENGTNNFYNGMKFECFYKNSYHIGSTELVSDKNGVKKWRLSFNNFSVDVCSVLSDFGIKKFQILTKSKYETTTDNFLDGLYYKCKVNGFDNTGTIVLYKGSWELKIFDGVKKVLDIQKGDSLFKYGITDFQIIPKPLKPKSKRTIEQVKPGDTIVNSIGKTASVYKIYYKVISDGIKYSIPYEDLKDYVIQEEEVISFTPEEAVKELSRLLKKQVILNDRNNNR